MMASEALISVSKLRAGYGKICVLHDISLTVGEGQFVAIVGANGAGKTTLIKSIMGLVPASGSIDFRGKPLLREPAHRRVEAGIGYIPEGRHVFPTLSVEENLCVTATRRGGKEAALEAIERAYELFPRLGERRRQAAGSLSGGEQQMLAFGRAMVLEPAVLIADEISLGLAPIVIDQLFDALEEMHKRGTTIVLAEQNARKALEAADYAYVIEAGQILLQGKAADLRTDPRVVEAYLQKF
jgi:branched-chain amino acid transport system ATP-binding protein